MWPTTACRSDRGHAERYAECDAEREYEHVKDSYDERGAPEDEAEERAARTVNKTRSEKGETSSRSGSKAGSRSKG